MQEQHALRSSEIHATSLRWKIGGGGMPIDDSEVRTLAVTIEAEVDHMEES